MRNHHSFKLCFMLSNKSCDYALFFTILGRYKWSAQLRGRNGSNFKWIVGSFLFPCFTAASQVPMWRFLIWQLISGDLYLPAVLVPLWILELYSAFTHSVDELWMTKDADWLLCPWLEVQYFYRPDRGASWTMSIHMYGRIRPEWDSINITF